MSLGIYGRCQLESEDDYWIVYSYSGENWNLDRAVRQEVETRAGAFMIAKNCLLEPEVRTRKRRVSKQRKALVEKRIVRIPDIGNCISVGDIIIEYCGLDAYELAEGIQPASRTALILIRHIFERYQKDGTLPESEFFIK